MFVIQEFTHYEVIMTNVVHQLIIDINKATQ